MKFFLGRQQSLLSFNWQVVQTKQPFSVEDPHALHRIDGGKQKYMEQNNRTATFPVPWEKISHFFECIFVFSQCICASMKVFELFENAQEGFFHSCSFVWFSSVHEIGDSCPSRIFRIFVTLGNKKKLLMLKEKTAPVVAVSKCCSFIYSIYYYFIFFFSKHEDRNESHTPLGRPTGPRIPAASWSWGKGACLWVLFVAHIK